MMDFSSDPYVAENQMKATIFLLVAFAYIDADFDAAERSFIKGQIAELVEHRARTLLGEGVASDRELVARWTQHFYEVFDEIDRSIQAHFTESVGEGETPEQFVLAKLKLGCFELIRRFGKQHQGEILQAVEQLIRADGIVHPSEAAFYDEILALVNAAEQQRVEEVAPRSSRAVIIDSARELAARSVNHPFFTDFEWDYAQDPITFAHQSRREAELVAKVEAVLAEKRAAGAGRLRGAASFADLAGQPAFLDGHVHVAPPQAGCRYELLVLGDLHGCYSCLKGALMQADFFSKVEAYQADPVKFPKPYLVLLGDYIDRGKFSYSGTLRTAMQLQVSLPDHVFMLRGNHEYYVQIHGRVVAPVRPCEAMDSLADVAGNAHFVMYMNLFEQLPTSLCFDQTFFVHGGLPRQDTLDTKWKDLQSLNDPEIRFQMLWSDPSEADVVPLELQQANARFPFGRQQFHRFMSTLGCRTMVRGHERVIEGFRKTYDDPQGSLLTLFSAGGATNDDLPPTSNYREVTPMALTLRWNEGVTTISPFAIDYERYNDPQHNAFFRERLSAHE